MNSCLICDDHALVREALAGTVRMGWPDIKIIEVGDFPNAWREAAKGHDFCIADLTMPGASPLAGIAGLMRVAPHMKVLIVTGTADDALMLALLDQGVAGFAPKTSNGSLIEAALRLILAGGRYLPPRIADIAASRFDTAEASAPADPQAGCADNLSSRQLEVLRLVAKGRSNKEIARLLDLAPSTVKTHLAAVMTSLDAANRMDAANKARTLNLL